MSTGQGYRRTVHTGMLAAVLCVLSPISLPVPGSPVPITLQTLAIMAACVILGRHAVMAVTCYLLAGALGFPVFSGFKGGAAVLFGPTGGFLLGFIPYSLFMGMFLERPRPSPPLVFFVLASANLLLYAAGIPWLSLYLGSSLSRAAGMCLVYIPGDVLKLLAVFLNFKFLLRFRRLI